MGMTERGFFACGEFGICFIISEKLVDILNQSSNYDNNPLSPFPDNRIFILVMVGLYEIHYKSKP